MFSRRVISRSVTSLQNPPAVSHLQVSDLVIRKTTASDNLRVFFFLSHSRCEPQGRRVARSFSSLFPSSQLISGQAKGGSEISCA